MKTLFMFTVVAFTALAGTGYGCDYTHYKGDGDLPKPIRPIPQG